jgi:hypothetical protein
MYQNFPKNTEPQYQSQTVYGQAQPAQYQPAQYGATVVYGTQPVYAAQPGQQVIITASPVITNGYQGPQPAKGTFSDESDSGWGRQKIISLSIGVCIFLGSVSYMIYSYSKPGLQPRVVVRTSFVRR